MILKLLPRSSKACNAIVKTCYCTLTTADTILRPKNEKNKTNAITSPNLIPAVQFLKDLKKFSLLDVQIKDLNISQIDGLLIQAADEENREDLLFIVRGCHLCGRLPSKYAANRVLMQVIEDWEVLWSLIEAYRMKKELWLEQENDLRHFEAAGLWYRGSKNSAYQLFRESYFEASKEVKETSLDLLRQITERSVGQNSEAVLLGLVRVAEYFSNIIGDYRLLAFIWKKLFESNWFSDQQLAADIFDRHPNLQLIVASRASQLINSFLTAHDLDTAYRLLPFFLQKEFRQACEISVGLIFDYHLSQRDLQGSSKLAQFALDVDISLSEDQHLALVNLLVEPTGAQSPHRHVVIKTPTYKFKF